MENRRMEKTQPKAQPFLLLNRRAWFYVSFRLSPFYSLLSTAPNSGPGCTPHLSLPLHICIASSVDPTPPTPEVSVGACCTPDDRTDGAGERAPKPAAAAAKAEGGGWWAPPATPVSAASIKTPAGTGTAQQAAEVEVTDEERRRALASAVVVAVVA